MPLLEKESVFPFCWILGNGEILNECRNSHPSHFPMNNSPSERLPIIWLLIETSRGFSVLLAFLDDFGFISMDMDGAGTICMASFSLKLKALPNFFPIYEFLTNTEPHTTRLYYVHATRDISRQKKRPAPTWVPADIRPCDYYLKLLFVAPTLRIGRPRLAGKASQLGVCGKYSVPPSVLPLKDA